MRFLLLAALIVSVINATNAYGQGTLELEGKDRLEELFGLSNDKLCFSISNELGDITGIGTIGSDGSNLETKSLGSVRPEDILFYTSNNQIVVLRTVHNDQKLELHYNSFNSHLEQTSSKIIASHLIQSTRNKGHFKMHISKSGKGIGILQETPLPRENPEHFNVVYIDPSGKIIWSKEYETTYPQSTKPTNQILADDNGDIHIIKRFRKGSKYEFHLYSFRDHGSSIEDESLEIRGKLIADMGFTVDYKHDLIISGFYTASTYDRHEGYFYFRYDSKGSLAYEKEAPLPTDLMTEYIGKKASKPDAALTNVFIEEILCYNGYTHLFLESIGTKSIREKDGTYQYQYIKGPVTMIDLDSTGKYIGAYSSLKNAQSCWSDQDYFSSFKVVLDPDISIFANSFESDDKSKSLILPATPVLGQLDVLGEFIKLTPDIDVPNGTLVAPSLIWIDPEYNWHIIVTDPDRKKIFPITWHW